jgi:NADH-quinone oxidoreductase subunit N
VALVAIGVLCSVVTAFVYVRLIVLMYFTEPAGGEVVAEMPSPMTTVALTVGTLVTLVLGVFPSQVLALAESSSQFLR